MTTYIFGHKNPDTDTVCSSIALSYLKNEEGFKTTPKVLGDLNNETKFVLNYFGVSEPSYLNDVRVRIKNVKYKHAFINENKTIEKAYKIMQKENITAIPLVNNKNILSGYVTLKELVDYLINDDVLYLDTSLDNIIEALNAKVIVKKSNLIKGNVTISNLKNTECDINEDSIVVLTTDDKCEKVIDKKVKLIILPINLKLSKKIINKADKNEVTIIATEYNVLEISKNLALSNYIKTININKSPVTLNIEDSFFDFKTMPHKINHTNYPVVNSKNECLGLIRLTGPNEFERRKVILVDHNNFSQSVDGIEEAEILEIIDHHNLGAIGTKVPINFHSKPVGCTATMVYELFLEKNISIPKNIAGLLLSAILSDTFLLTSPTTTDEDIKASKKLAKIAEVTVKKYGLEMLKAASSVEDMSIDEIIRSDFKSYVVGNKTLGISQIVTLDFDHIKKNIDEFISSLDNMCDLKYNHVVLFVTDIIKNGSYVIFDSKSKSLIEESFSLESVKQGEFLEGVVSRKKQMLPKIMNIFEIE